MTKRFTAKQQAFINEYLQCWNAAESARRAGYSPKTARFIGVENLSKPNIRAEIESRLAERAMSANEVLARLTEHARSDMADLSSPGGHFDFDRALEEGKTHLIKKLKRTIHTDKDGNTTERVEVELHDAQAALVQLGKVHGLFVERVKQEDWRTELIALLRAGTLTPQEAIQELGHDLAQELFVSAGVPVTPNGEG